MIYFYRNLFPLHWEMLVKMIQENYDTPEYKDHAIIVGICNSSVNSYKHNYNIKGPTVAYQLEPLNHNHWFNQDTIVKNLQGADEIWDYDLKNIEILNSLGFNNVKFRPMMLSDSLRTIQNVENPDIDVLFYGSVTPYRNKILDQLLNGASVKQDDYDIYATFNLMCSFGMFGKQLDDLIARSKIILNINPYENSTRQQQTRIFYALNNDKCVLSQRSDINYYGESIHQYSDANQLAYKIINLLRNDNWKIKPPNYNKGIFNPKNKSKIAIFHHVYTVNNWLQIYLEQLHKLQQSGLYDEADYIHVGISGDQYIPYDFTKINRIEINEHPDLEADTMNAARNFACANPDYRILYLHTKGVTRYETDVEQTSSMWRNYLEYFNILQWKRCVDLLSEYDVVGTELHEKAWIKYVEYNLPHYHGNFWWTTGKYLSKLDPDYIYGKNCDNWWGRYNSEFWLFQQNPKAYNFYTKGGNLYDGIQPQEYEGK